MTLLLPFDQRADDKPGLEHGAQRKPSNDVSERDNRVTPEQLTLTAHRKSDGRPRHWSVEAKAASIFIAHALEYFSDSRNLSTGRCTTLNAEDPNAQTIEILLQARRDIYLACPFIERRSKNGLKEKFFGFERRKDRQN
jgi:hypothetical protein